MICSEVLSRLGLKSVNGLLMGTGGHSLLRHIPGLYSARYSLPAHPNLEFRPVSDGRTAKGNADRMGSLGDLGASGRYGLSASGYAVWVRPGCSIFTGHELASMVKGGAL